MEKERQKKVYCTNMNEKDPVIENFMKEYLKENENNLRGCEETEDIMVNFDITYADGITKSYSCGAESPIFGDVDDECKEVCNEECNDGCIESKINFEDIENQCNCEKEFNFSEEERNRDIEINRENNCYTQWNCEEELNKICNFDRKEENRESREVVGNIIVYSTLFNKFGQRLKGVKINLYKLSGISPELVESRQTDICGMVVFKDIPKGSYRIIQLIDKRYFKKPVYINWNEVTIDEDNNESVIYVVNNIK